MVLRKKRRTAGYTALELFVAVAVLGILTLVVVVRLKAIRMEAIAAKTRANTLLVQGAYEQAKFLAPDCLSNATVGSFATAAFESGLTAKNLGPSDVAAITLLPGTSIPGGNAVFVSTNNNASPSYPPIVSISSPPPNLTVAVGQPIAFSGTATSVGSEIVRVELWTGGVKLGETSVVPWAFSAVATEADSTYMVRAYDAVDLVGTATVSVSTYLNSPPVVVWSSPSGSTFTTGATLTLQASPSDPDGSISRVVFLIDGSEIGTATSFPYQITWISTSGNHILTATAYDNFGATSSVDKEITVSP